MKRLIPALLLLLTISLSSCFEIVEQVTVNNTGGGTFTWTMNCSKSKDNLKTLFSQDSVMGRDMPSTNDVSARLDEAKTTLASMPGITGVQVTKDFTNYIFTMSASFSSITALDKALVNTIQAVAKPKNAISPGNFVFYGKNFSRKIATNYQAEMGTLNQEMRDMLSQSSYTYVHKFVQNIKSTSNPKAKIAPSKTSVMLKITMLELYTSKANFENIITLE